MTNPIIESGITTDELAEWKRLFESAPLEGFSYVNLQGGVSDDLPFSPSPSFEKAIALAEFLTAARTGWPRTVLDLESLRRECEEETKEFNDGFDAYKSGLTVSDEPSSTRHDMWRVGYAFSAFDDLRRERDELRAKLDAMQLCAEALRITEWFDDGDDEWYCPWCGNYKRNGHGSGCQRQTALCAASEAGLLEFHSVESVTESVEAHDPARLSPAMWRDEDEEDND